MKYIVHKHGKYEIRIPVIQKTVKKIRPNTYDVGIELGKPVAFIYD